MEHTLEQTIALLTRTPATLNALLGDLPDSWTHSNEGEATWTPIDVVGHLIDGERVNWLPRARHILHSAEPQPLPPFDRGGHARETPGKSLPQLLDEFARLRAENLEALRALNLTEQDLARRGLHPAFGPVTLSQLLATWATHDFTHLHKITRILAHQYRETVGPWQQYLGVLQCNGHSS
jgi:hypothetical protein